MSQGACCLLLFVAACAARPALVTPSCPGLACPDCVLAPCPNLSCPACDQLSTPALKATNWHCIDLLARKSKPDTSYCWISEEICQTRRVELQTRWSGKASVCQPQQVAHCFQVVEGPTMSRQLLCTRTAKDCSDVLKYFLARKTRFDSASACQPMHNNDDFSSTEEFESQRVDP